MARFIRRGVTVDQSEKGNVGVEFGWIVAVVIKQPSYCEIFLESSINVTWIDFLQTILV